MSDSVLFDDPRCRDDLRVFLERLERSGRPEARVVSRGRALAVYGCTQAPRGLTDELPVVLVMRAFPLREEPREPVDATVLSRALLDRLARGAGPGEVELALPDTTTMAAWAGVLPPASGWRGVGAIDAASLAAVAEDGIARVAAALPDSPGEAVVHRVRSEVWGAEAAPGVPASLAFAAESMGFLRDESAARLSHSRGWTRLSTSRGHAIARRAFAPAG